MGEVLLSLAAGCVFGLAAGFTPGPTTTLLIAQTLRFGRWDGIKVALAPLLTDAPIIAASLVLLSELARIEPVLGGITLLGAAFLTYLAVESFRVSGIKMGDETVTPHSLRKGFLVNLLNPHPYLFWFVVGAPTLLRAADQSVLAAALFVAGLYACLVGTKILIAVLVARSRSFLSNRAYVNVNRVLGVALAVFALLFLRDGLRTLGG
jgi:threonine/homoserine/homoserine lactone efflux protein